jgi:ribosome modulation factor
MSIEKQTNVLYKIFTNIISAPNTKDLEKEYKRVIAENLRQAHAAGYQAGIDAAAKIVSAYIWDTNKQHSVARAQNHLIECIQSNLRTMKPPDSHSDDADVLRDQIAESRTPGRYDDDGGDA